MNKTTIKQKLIEAGVKNLQEFGYPYVTVENILTDLVYSGFFASMLKDNLCKGNTQTDKVINELLAEIDKNQKA